ncbi:MAG: septum formation protein Maf [Candidatus Omnitrophica bacterium]|nr:septum formation protein Maf [Candidatus Omnitrophota bacterium]
MRSEKGKRTKMRQLILASASERRARILREAGIEHRVVIAEVEEHDGAGSDVMKTVVHNAGLKASSVAEKVSGPVVIAADTLVVHDDEIIGKPADENAARDLLSRFSGTRVDVYTGLCVHDTLTGRRSMGAERSELYVVDLSVDEKDRFFRLMAPYDKAGGFSIEGAGALLFDNIRGSYFNILGLPMIKLRELFSMIDLELLDLIGKRTDTSRNGNG